MLNRWDAIPMLDRVFNDVMGGALGHATNAATFAPDVDIVSKDTEVVFQFDVPGVKREDIEVTLEHHVLSVRGSPQENARLSLGRAYGDFALSYTLPDEIDGERLSAELADGVLTLRLPKQPKVQPRRIQIGSGSPVR